MTPQCSTTNSAPVRWSALEEESRGAASSGSRAGTGVGPARGFLRLAVGSLIIAGCLSLMLVAGRLPGVAERIGDPLFFKRCLVVHVDLALVVWFGTFAVAMFGLLPATPAERRRYVAGWFLAVAGVALLLAGALVPGAHPVLSNYVPVIGHPVFLVGLGLFFGGLLLAFLDGRLFRPVSPLPAGSRTGAPLWVPPEVAAGLKTSALAYLVAMVTLVWSWAGTPRGLEERFHYELVFWGAGHVLQVANVAAMLSAWLWLLGSLLGHPVVSPGRAWLLFGLLLAPHLAGPLLVRDGTLGADYRLGFTRLMQFGIAPVVLLLLGSCVTALVRAAREGRLEPGAWRDPRMLGFVLSAAMTVAGFILGACIRSATTLVPGHYHAAIGAVTMAFMAMTYVLLEPMGLRFDRAMFPRLVPAQLACFGVGQVVFALGFGWAGLNGAARKAYGAEQHVRSASELAGLWVMGIGGAVAVVGGLAFLGIVIRAWRRRGPEIGRHLISDNANL